jgi:hypothetical protein
MEKAALLKRLVSRCINEVPPSEPDTPKECRELGLQPPRVGDMSLGQLGAGGGGGGIRPARAAMPARRPPLRSRSKALAQDHTWHFTVHVGEGE